MTEPQPATLSTVDPTFRPAIELPVEYGGTSELRGPLLVLRVSPASAGMSSRRSTLNPTK